MTGTRNIGIILAALWFILTGLISIMALTMTAITVVMGVLAIAAGIFLLFGR